MRHFAQRRTMLGVAAVSVAALTLSGCTGTSYEYLSSEEILAEIDDCVGTYAGETVEIYTTIVEPESTLFQESFLEFEECTGILIEWNGDQAFEEQIAVRVAGGTAPDLAIFPQPGLLSAFEDDLVPASDALNASVDESYTADWKNYGSVDGTLYAAPLGANVKSFVWYSPKTFADNGWDIPTTWDELIALSDEIAGSDFAGTAWCVGIESGSATGWALTDWMEDLMLRFQDAETYDAWVDNSMPFNDPRVLEVIGEAGKIIKNPDYIDNIPAIATTSFQAGGAGIVDGTCAMHRQASFIGGILEGDFGATIVSPDQTDVEGGITTFYFPGVTAEDRPALGGGEFLASFTDRPAAQIVQYYLTTAEWNNKKAALGTWFSPHLGLDTANVADPVNKVAVEILQNASTFRFDASDLMPGEVGTGSFWSEMTAWVAEDKADQDVLDAIQATWPAS
jgi:alpha-glucoside transport system substrate-binding protein